jgi:hypothetical protein
MPQQNQTNDLEQRKARILIIGVGFGALFGFISSYLYARAAEENDNPDAGTVKSISTGQLLGILLAIMGIIRQISELGKPDKKDKKK